MNWNATNNRLHLNPDPDGSGGGAAAPGDSPAGAAAPATPAFDPQVFESKITGLINQGFQQFGGKFRSELDQRFSQFQPSSKQPDSEPSGAPSIHDKKYLNAQGEMDAEGFQKYQSDALKHALKEERAQWEKDYKSQQGKQQHESTIRSVRQAHYEREAEYEKANPSYQQDLMAVGDLQVEETVGARLLKSPYSAHILHHLVKNPVEWRKFQMLSFDDPEAAIERIGELGYQFKSADTSKTQGVPNARPTRGAFGGSGARPTQRSREEIVKDWRS